MLEFISSIVLFFLVFHVVMWWTVFLHLLLTTTATTTKTKMKSKLEFEFVIAFWGILCAIPMKFRYHFQIASAYYALICEYSHCSIDFHDICRLNEKKPDDYCYSILNGTRFALQPDIFRMEIYVIEIMATNFYFTNWHLILDTLHGEI